MAHDWRAHEALVGLSLDVRELREAERGLLGRRARLEALERELGGLADSSGGSDGRESASTSESESGEGEATGSGGSGEE